MEVLEYGLLKGLPSWLANARIRQRGRHRTVQKAIAKPSAEKPMPTFYARIILNMLFMMKGI